MDYEKRIPVLVKAESDIDFGNKSFYEPKIARCDNCGANIFYIGFLYGLNKRDYDYLSSVSVVGETEESKKYRMWEISLVSEQKICAVCGCRNGILSVCEDDMVAKEFEEESEKEYYDCALDLLKYPNQPQQEKLIRYDSAINQIKKWIERWEEEEIKRISFREEEKARLLKKKSAGNK